MKTEFGSQRPIGVFDSGVGGLSVLRAVRQELPGEDILYVGDQAHIPYGPRSQGEIQQFSVAITHFLLKHGAKLILVACNTASGAALHHLREEFKSTPIVGMEPAVKPAAAATQTGKVGVLATATTFAGDPYASLVDRFAQGIEIYQSTCPGLVEQVEDGELAASTTRTILKESLSPMQSVGVDTVVLGCTHYPFVIPLIRDIVGPDVHIIDPAPAVARQVGRVLSDQGLCNAQDKGVVKFFTSGDPARLHAQIEALIEESGVISPVYWTPELSLRSGAEHA